MILRILVICFVILWMGSPSVFSKGLSDSIYPKKVEVDKNFDGNVDYIEYYIIDQLTRIEIDTDFDGKIDDWTDYNELGNPIHKERDTNGDGRADTWITY